MGKCPGQGAELGSGRVETDYLMLVATPTTMQGPSSRAPAAWPGHPSRLSTAQAPRSTAVGCGRYSSTGTQSPSPRKPHGDSRMGGGQELHPRGTAISEPRKGTVVGWEGWERAAQR